MDEQTVGKEHSEMNFTATWSPIYMLVMSIVTWLLHYMATCTT